MTKFKRKKYDFEKLKKLGILLLCITLFFTATSVTLSLFKKDKTTSPIAPELPPLYFKEYNNIDDFSRISSYPEQQGRFTWRSDEDDLIIIHSTNASSLDYDEILFHFEYPSELDTFEKIKLEYSYTLGDCEAYIDFGFMYWEDEDSTFPTIYTPYATGDGGVCSLEITKADDQAGNFQVNIYHNGKNIRSFYLEETMLEYFLQNSSSLCFYNYEDFDSADLDKDILTIHSFTITVN